MVLINPKSSNCFIYLNFKTLNQFQPWTTCVIDKNLYIISLSITPGNSRECMMLSTVLLESLRSMKWFQLRSKFLVYTFFFNVQNILFS